MLSIIQFLNHLQASQIVVMLTFLHHLSLEAIFVGIIGERLEIDIKPIERLTLDLLILHAEIDFAIISCCQVYQEASVFIFKQIAEVA